MCVILSQLLLSSGNETLEDWLLAVVWWIPQLIWIGFAMLLLFGVMRGLRRFWIRWILMWLPYLIIGWLVIDALRVHHWDYTRDNPLSLIAHDSDLRAYWAPTFLALPLLIVLHIVLFRKQAQRKARGA